MCQWVVHVQYQVCPLPLFCSRLYASSAELDLTGEVGSCVTGAAGAGGNLPKLETSPHANGNTSACTREHKNPNSETPNLLKHKRSKPMRLQQEAHVVAWPGHVSSSQVPHLCFKKVSGLGGGGEEPLR